MMRNYLNSMASNIQKADKGTLQYVNLKNVRFHTRDVDGTKVDDYENLQKLQFINCEFNNGKRLYEDVKYNSFFYLVDKIAVFIMYLLYLDNKNDEEEKVLAKRLASSYLYLYKHYDGKDEYIDGNDFYYNYRIWENRSLEWSWDKLSDKIFLFLYSFSSGCNTRPVYSIISLLFVVIMSGLMIACNGDFEIKTGKETYKSKSSMSYQEQVENSFLYSTKSLVPILQSDMFIPTNYASRITTTTENALGPILIALFVIAFRNRFRRSKTPEEIKEN